MIFHFTLLDEAAARAVLEWRYEPPYDVYNPDPNHSASYLADLLNPHYAYHAMWSGQPPVLVAFCCFGPDAQVPGGDYSAPALDLGLGVRPDLTGQGHGLDFVQAVCGYACAHFKPPALRATIAQFNRRAQRVWEKAGFQQAQRFCNPDGIEFVIFTKPDA